VHDGCFMKTKATTRRRYVQIDDIVYQAVAFATLPPSALKLWLDMRIQLNGFNNGRVVATMSTLCKRGWTSPPTLHRALRQLLARGLIDRTRQGKPGPARICSLFRFTDLATPKDEGRFIEARPSTHEYSRWEPDVKKIRATKTEAMLIPKLNSYRYRNGRVDAATATETEAQKNGETARQVAPMLVQRRLES